jgi:uncharacterized protein (DUF58 family)
LWGRFLFQGRGILPTQKFLIVYLILSIGLIIGTIWGIPWSVVILLNGLVLIGSLMDLFFSARRSQLIINRTLPEEMERGLPYNVQITITNASGSPIRFRLVDEIPQSFKRPFPLHGSLLSDTTSVFQYETEASVRGKYEVNKLHFRYKSVIGLWEKQATVEIADTVKVIPDLTETKQYLESAQQFLLHEGLRIRKQKSGAGEFTKIRNYVVGDDPRKINWRQTAKLREVMSNEYEPEHGKYITLLIDCGRMMGAELTKGNRLEKALEAAITVAAAALKNGDYVSVLAFSKDVKVFVPPAKGMEHLQTILHSIYNIQVDSNESNYAAILHYLQTVQKKRSLLLLFSDVRTFLHEEAALIYLKRLRRRHLFLMIGIEDVTLLARIKDEPVSVQSAMVKSMAQQQMLIKKREKLKWEKQGLQMIETREEKLAAAAVTHYIDIMNRGLL